jgi:uncharacterized membrane protein YhdT
MEDKNQPTSSFLQVAKSISAAFLGVQSEENRQRDFTQGNPKHYIIAGAIGTIIFIVVLWIIVKVVVNLAGVP